MKYCIRANSEDSMIQKRTIYDVADDYDYDPEEIADWVDETPDNIKYVYEVPGNYDSFAFELMDGSYIVSLSGGGSRYTSDWDEVKSILLSGVL